MDTGQDFGKQNRIRRTPRLGTRFSVSALGKLSNLKSGKVWEISQRGDGGQRFRVKIPNAVYYNNVAGLENSQPDPRRKI